MVGQPQRRAHNLVEQILGTGYVGGVNGIAMGPRTSASSMDCIRPLLSIVEQLVDGGTDQDDWASE
jgi:hypothetical protein